MNPSTTDATSKVAALAMERDALWSRISSADFLSEDEKRRLAGVEHLLELDDRDRRVPGGLGGLVGPVGPGRTRCVDRIGVGVAGIARRQAAQIVALKAQCDTMLKRWEDAQLIIERKSELRQVDQASTGT